jgi:UDP-N-acetylmuramate dehydrogenase
MITLTDTQISQMTSVVPGLVRDEPMSAHTNFRIGGPARLYVVAATPEQIIQTVTTAREASVPWYIFGGGSNLLVHDSGFEGLVIQSALRDVVIDGNRATCGSGAMTALVARKTTEASLTGFEWAIGVPGTIGGALYGNAGCYGGETKDVVTSVDAYRIADGQRVTYTNAECQFGYRESRFKHEPHIILGCTMELKAGDRDASRARLHEIVEHRKEKQPLAQSSAGCLFKNIEVTDEQQLTQLKRLSDIPPEMLQKRRISAGWLIQQAGFSGQRVGGVTVSEKHGNFVVNVDHGRAEDVILLSSMIKSKIRDEFGLMLEDEVQLLGF